MQMPRFLPFVSICNSIPSDHNSIPTLQYLALRFDHYLLTYLMIATVLPVFPDGPSHMLTGDFLPPECDLTSIKL